jgi:hypothetical protein
MKLRAAFLIAVASSVTLAAKSADDFARYPARVTSAHAQPVFRDGYRDFRTVTRRAMKSGVNFAGYLTLVEVGCGAGCIAGWLVDRRNGRIIDAPVAGEEYPVLHYDVRANSRLLRTEWLVDAGLDSSKGCVQQNFLWDGSKFRALNKAHRASCEFDEHK